MSSPKAGTSSTSTKPLPVPGTSKAKDKDHGKVAKQPRKAVVEDTLMLNVVQSYFKKAAIVLAVWATGYYKFSPSWLLLGLVLYVWKEKNQAAKKNTIAIAQEIARDEKGLILARVDDLPSWVFFPDVERAEWVNKMIDQLWPFIGEYVRKLLQEQIEPQIKASLPPSLSSFKFSKIDLGDIPPRVGGVKVYTHEVRRDEIYMDLEINYASDCNIAVSVKGMQFGIKDFTLRGTLRNIFRPLINKVPLVGGISVFFLNNPEVDFNLTSLANAFDLPGLSDMLHTIVREQIAGIMVLPNRIPVQLADTVDIKKLRYPQPQGVLRVHVLEAKDLKRADISLTGKGKSDPYATVTVGAQVFQTKVLDNTVNPRWNEVFEFIVDERDGQLLNITLSDKDPGNKDDPLGGVTLDIAHIFEKGTIDEWLPLEDVKTGMIHIRTTWLYLANDPLELDRALDQVKDLGLDEDSVHSALLIVNLDSAQDLPRSKKTLVEPSPQAFMTLGQKTIESAVRQVTCEPRWEQNFRFFVANPNHQSLDIEVRDAKSKKTLGTVSVRLKELLSAPDMMIEKKWHMTSTEQNTSIFMATVLRVLTPEASSEWMESEHLVKEGEEGSSVDGGVGSEVDQAQPGASGADAKAGTDATPGGGEGREEVIKPASSPSATESELRQRKAASAASSSAGGAEEGGEHGLGRIQLTLRYSQQRQCLIIVVHKISNLKPAEGDSKGLADPYIKMYLLPDRDSKSKRKTHVEKDNLNPVFDETFEYEVRPMEVGKRTLELTVKNETGMFSSSQTVLGMVQISLNTLDIGKAVTEWFDLAPLDKVRACSLESEV